MCRVDGKIRPKHVGWGTRFHLLGIIALIVCAACCAEAKSSDQG